MIHREHASHWLTYHGHASRGHVSHRRASRRRVFYRRGCYRRVSYRHVSHRRGCYRRVSHRHTSLTGTYLSQACISQACILEAAVLRTFIPIEQATRPAVVLCGMGWGDQALLNGSGMRVLSLLYYARFRLDIIESRVRIVNALVNRELCVITRLFDPLPGPLAFFHQRPSHEPQRGPCMACHPAFADKETRFHGQG